MAWGRRGLGCIGMGLRGGTEEHGHEAVNLRVVVSWVYGERVHEHITGQGGIAVL